MLSSNPSFLCNMCLLNFLSSILVKIITSLQTSNGKQWHVRCHYHQYSASSAMKMSKGCAAFFKDNNLEEGDVCVFKVIKRKFVVLSISIFHVVDHQSSD